MRALILAAAALLAAAPAAGQGLRVLDRLVLVPSDSQPLREVSGLAFDPEARLLWAVSDRNDLYALALDPGADRLALRLIAHRRLTGPDGARLRRAAGFSAEGLARDGASLVILSESAPRLARFDGLGRWLAELPLPAALADPARLRNPGNGPEALAIHPALGLLAAPETPLAGSPRRVHVLHGTQGPALAWETGAPATSLKALETLPDGSLLALERFRDAAGTIHPLLRRIDPAACPPERPCAPPALPLPPGDADFEGLAWLGGGRAILASDDRIAGQARTVFLLVALD